MEGEVVLRGLALVAVWAIPAMLVLAVAALVLAAPIVTLVGVVIRLYEAVVQKLPRKARAET